jgi:hypothetical protein
MYFRVRYIIRDFVFGDAQISVSDPARQIDVLISKRPGDETHPPLEPSRGVAIATCQRELPARHHDEAVSSGSLSIKREVVGQVHHDLYETILHTLRLARWRANSPGRPDQVWFALEFSWCLDGTGWKPVADNLRLQIVFGSLPRRWTNEAAEFLRTEVLGELDEPLGHELLREAAASRENSLRSSLVLAVVAAEVGFKQFASKAFPETDWILEKLPSPPLETMLKAFPWSKLGVQINGKVPGIPDSIQNELRKAVLLRNQIVHTGVPAKLKGETVDSVLTTVRDLLYLLDALRGQTWAASHVSPDTLKSLS